jgi:hypothetical protein
MSDHIDRVLDDCLTELVGGAASVEDCLSRYPEQADDLRPLLEVAVQVHALEWPEMRAVASAAAKRQMLLALSDKERHLRQAPRSLSAVASGFLSLLGEGGKRKQQRSRTLLIGAAAAIMVVMLTLVPGVLVEMGRYGVVGQAAVVAEVVGMVEVRHQPVAMWRPVTSDTVLASGYSIRTGGLSAATIRFFDGSKTILGADTELAFRELSSRRDGSGRRVVLYQRQGQTQNQVEKLADAASLFEIDTPTAVAVVHGTEFQVDVATDGGTSVSVIEGRVGVTADGATQFLAAGQFASVLPPSTEPTTAPTATLVPTPEAEPWNRAELAEVTSRAATPSPTVAPPPTATAYVAEEPEGPEGVEEREHPEHPVHPVHPEHPEHPEHPATPEHPEPPEKPDKPDKPSKE